jgi:putative addiction module component (TIGR02574 family)
VLADAMSLSPDERAELVEELIALAPVEPLDPAQIGEIERRARRAQEQPEGGEAWDVVRARLRARLG